MIAALYVDSRGPYPRLLTPGQCWSAGRDARRYAGPGPVVAHPPCGPWSSLRHQYRGAEHDCALRAVSQVRSFGGVLEHPASSKLWPFLGLPEPGDPLDVDGGFTLEVEQVAWGHVARKCTRLYVVGVDRAEISAEVRTGGTPTHWCGGSRGKAGRNLAGTGGGVPPGIKVCSAEQRRRTPEAFARWLISIAERARPL